MHAVKMLAAERGLFDAVRRLGAQRLLLIALLNLIPVGGVLWLGWNAGQILMLYWVENIIVGALTVGRILTAQGRSPNSKDDQDWGRVGFGLFFTAHYGIFTVVHGVFTMILAARLMGGAGALWRDVFANPVFHWAVLAAGGVQIVFTMRDWWLSGLWRRSTPVQEMFRPYGRIVVLHVTVLAAAWGLSALSAPVWPVLVLCLMKAVVELVMTALTTPSHSEG